MSRRLPLFGVLALIVATGCSHRSDRPATTLTEAQRDTAIARSVLPGADVVGRAMQVSGREARRATRMDSLEN